MKNNITGNVYVCFAVNEDGNISDTEIIKSLGNILLDEEIMRVVNSTLTWKPGKKQGKNVKVHFTLPIDFYLIKTSSEQHGIGCYIITRLLSLNFFFVIAELYALKSY